MRLKQCALFKKFFHSTGETFILEVTVICTEQEAKELQKLIIDRCVTP